MIVDALVGFGYPFRDLMQMTFTELREWLLVAKERAPSADPTSGA